MTSYVDDCDLDRSRATSRARLKGCANTICSERSGTHAENFLVLCRGHRLTQGDFTAKVLEDAVKLGFGPIRVCRTAGQSVTPPDPKLLPEQPCDPGVRELIGSLLFLSRCTHFDMSFVIARLARFVTRWCEWARKEISTSSVLLHTLLNSLSS